MPNLSDHPFPFAMHNLSEHAPPSIHRRFINHWQSDDGETLDRLMRDVADRNFPINVKDIHVAVSSTFAPYRLPTIRGPSHEPLDSASMGEEDNDDAIDLRSVMLVAHAFVVLNSLSLSYTPFFNNLDPFLVELWPTMWKWLVFLSKDVLDPATSPYRELHDIAWPWPAAAYFLGEMLCTHVTPLSDLIISTPDMAPWAARIWAQDTILDWRQPSGLPYTFNGFTLSMIHENVCDTEAILEAAGGTVPMARAIVAHLEHALMVMPMVRKPDLDSVVGLLHAPIHILWSMIDVAAQDFPEDAVVLFRGSGSPSGNSIIKGLLDALISEGLVDALVAAAKQLTLYAPADAGDMATDLYFRTLYWLIQSICVTSDTPFWLCQAIDAGLLLAIARSAPMYRNAAATTRTGAALVELTTIVEFSETITALLITLCYYRSVLRSIKRALREVESATTAEERNGMPNWQTFVTVASRQIRLKREFDKNNVIGLSKSDCERPGCLEERGGYGDVKQCRRCLAVFYCSQSCQTADWPIHKAACKRGKQRLREGIHIPLSKHDKAFVIHLARCLILASWKDVVRNLIRQRQGRPGLLVDFRQPADQVKLIDADDESCYRDIIGAEEWNEVKKQARKARCLPWVAVLLGPKDSSSYVRGLTQLWPHRKLTPPIINKILQR